VDEAEMRFEDARFRIVNLMAQKGPSICQLAEIIAFASHAFDNI